MTTRDRLRLAHRLEHLEAKLERLDRRCKVWAVLCWLWVLVAFLLRGCSG